MFKRLTIDVAKYLPLFFAGLIGLFFSSCSDKEDEDDSLLLTDILGTWICQEDNNARIVFEDDGEGYSLIGNSREYFEWSFKNGSLIIKSDDSDDGYFTAVLVEGSRLVFEYKGYNYTKTYTPDNGSEGNRPSNSDYDKNLIGEWWDGDVLSSLSRYFFCANGAGYRIVSKKGDDYGLKYEGFKWNTKDKGKLNIQIDGYSSSRVYDYSLTGKNLNLKEGNYGYEWRKMGDEVDESFDADKPPFANNYLKNKNDGYYYEIKKVTSGCNHAGAGDNMNEQFIHFFGSDGLLTTTGLRIVYYTPRWEGIDSYWRSGSYTMSARSGAYKYVAMAWCNGRKLDTYEGARFKVSRTGSITTYDFSDSEIELHVLVKSN